MTETAKFWYVHAVLSGKSHDFDARREICLAVAAFTERSARMQARKRLGKAAIIKEVGPVQYAHAWVIDHSFPTPTEDPR